MPAILRTGRVCESRADVACILRGSSNYILGDGVEHRQELRIRGDEGAIPTSVPIPGGVYDSYEGRAPAEPIPGDGSAIPTSVSIPGGVYDSYEGRAPAEPGAAIAMSHQPTEAMVSAAPPLLGSPVLVVGVLSFIGTVARRRRDIQRRACGADADAALRFVMVASKEAAAEATALGDVVQVVLPQNGSRWVHLAGKLMLQNALLRFASSLPACVRFIARADDDALFNAGAIARLLLPSTAAAQSELIVFGPFRNVYAWHVESMTASCWNYGLYGSLRCINSFKATRANDTLVGPFHFAAGPFIAYSRPLAVELATLLRHSGTEATC